MTTPQPRKAARSATSTKARQLLVLRLRGQGQTFARIADYRLGCPTHGDGYGPPDGWDGGLRQQECGCYWPLYSDRGAARKGFVAAASTPDIEELRREALHSQLTQIEAMIEAAASCDTIAERILALTRLWRRQAALLGLDADRRIVVTPELDEQLHDLAEQLVNAAAGDQDGDDTQ